MAADKYAAKVRLRQRVEAQAARHAQFIREVELEKELEAR